MYMRWEETMTCSYWWLVVIDEKIIETCMQWFGLAHKRGINGKNGSNERNNPNS
jgi:hypothetical protein